MTSTKTLLPLSRVTTIMKSSSDVENVGKESTIIMARAAELFIRKLVIDGYNHSVRKDGNSKTLEYKCLADIVQRDEKYEFLRDMMPRMITVKEYKKIMAKKREEETSDDEDDEETDEDDEDSEASSRCSSSTNRSSS